MTVTVEQVLRPDSVVRTISRITPPRTTVSQMFGVLPSSLMAGAENAIGIRHPLRSGSYDIFDFTRDIATATRPGMPRTNIAPYEVGKVNFTIPRSAEKMQFLYEKLNNLRAIGQPAGVVDDGGMAYIRNQLTNFNARYAHLIEFQLVAMIRGKYYYYADGDTLHHSFSQPTDKWTAVDFQRPASHLNQLDLTGDGAEINAPWSTAGTDIPAQIFGINRAQIENTGMGIENIVLSSATWQYVVNNTKIINQGGSANTVYETISRPEEGRWTVQLRAMPWITWHIVDYGINTYNPSTGLYEYTQLIPNDYAAFLPAINGTWFDYLLGFETVIEGPNGRQVEAYGLHVHSYPEHDPACHVLAATFNACPQNPVPKAIAYGKVANYS